MKNYKHGCLLLALTNVFILVSGDNLEHCYANNTKPYLHFGTKTAYKLVYGDQSSVFKENGCTPIAVWSVVRHGTRYPFFNEFPSLKQLKKLRDQILESEESFQNVDLCLEDLENLKSWKFQLLRNKSSLLTEQGRKEMYSLGYRINEHFPQIFKSGYSPEKFVFQTTDSARSLQSSDAFLQGLFKLANTDNMTSVNNSLLKAYKNCTVWKFEFGTNKQVSKVMTHFSDMKIMQQLVQNVSSRLGFFFTLDSNAISDMYLMCRYDRAFNQSTAYISPWCSVFTEEQLKILEFKEDLFYYYKHGYGLPINVNLGCPLVKDMITKFSEAIEKESEAKSVVYFTNHGMFERLLARLEFLKDKVPLTEKNVTSKSRLWRTSLIPFGANLVVPLYKCQAEGNLTNYKVVFYLNEKIHHVEDCDSGVCDWDTIQNKYTNITNVKTCRLDDCYVGRGVALSGQITFYINVLLFLLVAFIFLKAT